MPDLFEGHAEEACRLAVAASSPVVALLVCCATWVSGKQHELIVLQAGGGPHRCKMPT